MITLPLIALVLLYLCINKYQNNWRKSLILAVVFWALFLTLSTEFLSLFKLIKIPYLGGFWLLCNLICLLLFWRTKSTKEQSNTKLSKGIFRDNSIWLLGIVSIATILGLIAIVAAPNTADSMTYHMSRVMHWQQNQSVAHYPTHIGRQLYQSPWAEFAILHLQILSGNEDNWANLVQWSSMVGSVIGVSLIAEQLGANLRGQILSAVVAITIPMGILQSSSTQNDYVVSFWVICFTYYTLLLIKQDFNWLNILAASASMGLAILTKATAYIYVLPIFIWLLITLTKKLHWRIWQPFIVGGGLVVLINLGHYLRNISVYGAPIASDASEPRYLNELFSTSFLLSNLLRNIGLHLGTPIGLLNAISNKIIHLLHLPLGVDINDPRSTYIDLGKFGIPGGLTTIGIDATENNTSNTIHLLLIVAAIILFFCQRKLRKQPYLGSYLLVVGGIFGLFCLLLKWQWWHSRLHLPIFLLLAAFVGVVGLQIRQQRVINVLVILLFCASVPWIFTCHERPLIGEHNIFTTPRIEQYFRSKTRIREDYLGAAALLNSQECRQIGFHLGYSDYEYPLWVMLHNQNHPGLRIQHVDVANESASKYDDADYKNFSPCAIVSTRLKEDVDSHEYGKNYEIAWSSPAINVFVKP